MARPIAPGPAFSIILSQQLRPHARVAIDLRRAACARQLSSGSGDITPAVIISDTTDMPGTGAGNYPQFVVFDKSGSLWVSDESGSQLLKFAASQLSTGGDKTAAVVISNDGSGSVASPGQLAFDKKGNLWVTNIGNSTVVMFQKGDLSASGSPTPKVVLTSSAGSLDSPFGLAFQGKGSLWVANINTGTFSKFLPQQIKTSGAPAPNVFLQASSTGPYQITFGPFFR